MNLKLLLVIAFFVILISLQYALNKILKEVRDIKEILIEQSGRREEKRN